MNTQTPGGSTRWWLSAGILLMGAGVLALRFTQSGAEQPDSHAIGPVLLAEVDDATDDTALSFGQAERPAARSAVTLASDPLESDPEEAALLWRLEPLKSMGDFVPLGGTLALETRAPGQHWTSHGPLQIQSDLRISFPTTPAVPFEYRVTSLAYPGELCLLDDRGFVGDSASEVVLRVDGEARVAVHSSVTGEELRTVWIAEAATPAPGARPAFDSPGPMGFQVALREVVAPFPARILHDLDRPLVSADGCAWRAISDRVALGGGRVLLDPGHDVLVHVDASAAVAAGGIEELTLQLMEDAVGRWGLSSVSVTLSRAQAPDGRLEGEFRFRGVPRVIRSAAAEARWWQDPLVADAAEETARGFGGLSAEGDRVQVSLRPDRPEEIVEGYIALADTELAEQVTEVALSSVGGAIHVESLFVRRLGLGKGLDPAGEGLLRWECKDLRPGRYGLLLKPLGIYCTIDVESTELGMQTLLSEVPPLVSVGVYLADSDGAIITGERCVGVTAFVAGAGAERPMVTWPLQVRADEGSSPKLGLRVPQGSRCFVEISSADRSTRGEFLAAEGGVHEYRLGPKMRWVTLRRTVPAGEAAASLRWWEQNVYRLNERGEEEAIVYRPRNLDGAPSESAFTAWGLARQREPSCELDVAVPEGAGTLVVRGAFPGAGDEILGVQPGMNEVLISSY